MYSPLDASAGYVRIWRSVRGKIVRMYSYRFPKGKRRGEEHGRENANRNLSGRAPIFQVLRVLGVREAGGGGGEIFFRERRRRREISVEIDNCTVGRP